MAKIKQFEALTRIFVAYKKLGVYYSLLTLRTYSQFGESIAHPLNYTLAWSSMDTGARISVIAWKPLCPMNFTHIGKSEYVFLHNSC